MQSPWNFDTFLMLYCTEIVAHGGLDGIGAGVWNDVSPCGDMMFFASLKMMLLHFVSQWCDVCHKMWRSHASLGESRHHWQRQHHLPKANIIEKRRLLSQSSFFLAGAGGLEPATHGFGVAPKCRQALKLLAFSHVSTHFSNKTTCRNCVWKFLMLFWWYDKISAYILAVSVLLTLLKIWGAINKEENF